MASTPRATSRSSKTNGHVSSYPQPEWDDVLPVPRLHFSVASVLVFCLAVLCFVNSYDGDFVFDDSEAIIGNKDLLPETPLQAVFAHDFWGRKLDSKTSHKSYRPLTIMTYRWNYAWADGLHPLGFHVVNIALHGLVSVIFLAVFSVLMSGYQVDQESARPVFASPRASLLCAVLFAVHPIHTESVAGVVGRADLLCALTFLLSFLLYARACLSPSSQVSYRPESFSLVSLLASMCLCVVSTFCKEQGITVIGVCCVFDIIVVCRVDPFQLLPFRKPKKSEENGHNGFNNNHVKSKSDISPWVKGLIMRHLILFVTGASLLITRLRVMGSTTPIFQVHDNPHSFVNGTILKILNYNYLYAINSWLLINPWWLCFDWSMGCIPVITSLTDPRILVDIALWGVFGALVFQCCRGGLTKDRRILITALAVLGVPFLPASNLFFRVGFVIAERILYLSCAGFCMLVVLGARQICIRLHNTTKQLVSSGFYIIIVLFILRSIQRSSEWREEMTLFSSGVKVCPLNAKVHYNIAKLQADNNNKDVAIDKYRQAIRLNPQYDQAMNNLANILKENGVVLEAEQLLQRAVSIRADFAAAWMNLGIVQAELKKNESAEASYLEALRHRKKYPDCYYNLGNLYLDMGRHTDAIRAWLNATQLRPTHMNAWTNTLILLDNLGKYENAILVGKEAMKVMKNEPQLMFNMANIYGKMEKYMESEELFLSAIKIDKHNPKFYLNLGVLYHRWGKNKQAEAAYIQAQKLEPRDPSIAENLQMLHRKMGKLK
ncbi:protein O-mannosyl-transferase TMTC4-like [Haliotis asinina]|uniref:protein O-mannosyl-transferase TMTC4-like n=1 Tax=Haliotis asinina TaxID=109174 RepID=UPI003532792E